MRSAFFVLRAIAVVCLVVGVATTASAAQKLVLRGGATVDITSARVQGDQVYVTFPNGRMQAYDREDVDLDASGLAPAAPAEKPAAGEQPPAGSLAAARSVDRPASRMTITDQDVAHVKPEEPGAGEKGETSPAAAAASLLISDLHHDLTGATLSVTGTVQNSGEKSVSSITLQAVAVSGEGKTVGTGNTTISQELKPKQSVGFSLGFQVDGPVADVRVRAVAAVANFDFTSVEPPQPQKATGGEGGAGGEAAPRPSPQPRAAAEEPSPPPGPMQWAPQSGAPNQWAAPTPAPKEGGGE